MALINLGNLFGGGGNTAPAKPTNSGANRQASLGPPPKFEGSFPNRRTLIATDLITAGTAGFITGLSTSVFNDIGGFAVPAQTAIRFGFGSPGGGYELNQGFLYASLIGAPSVQTNGFLRFNAENARQTNIQTMLEIRTDLLKSSQVYTKAEQVPQPEVDPVIYRDSFLRQRFKPDSVTTVIASGSTEYVPITEYY